jgi:DNA-binding MltR family transcriptional regulator
LEALQQNAVALYGLTIHRMNHSQPDFGPFFEALRGESDRAAAVLGPAYVDAALERLFRARLTEGASDDLFKYGGPLGDFSGRIEMAYALGWIPTSLRVDLHIMRRIRNDFAHASDHRLSFESDSVQQRTLHLTVNEQFTKMAAFVTANRSDRVQAEAMRSEMVDSLVGTPRRRFEIAVANAEIFLGNAVRASTHALENRFQWTMQLLGSTDQELGANDAIDLTQLKREP